MKMFLARCTVAAIVLPCFFINYVLAEPARDVVLDRGARSVLLGGCSTCTEIRLTEGCSGVLEVLSEDHGYATATDRDFGANETMVVCRQLGCPADGDEEPERTFTDFSRNDVYQGFGYQCNGNEQSLSECTRRGATVRAEYGIAITCGAETTSKAALVLSLLSAIIATYIIL